MRRAGPWGRAYADAAGLAYGSRYEEGRFSFTIGTPERYAAPQHHITESPIDVLGRVTLIQRGYTAVSSVP